MSFWSILACLSDCLIYDDLQITRSDALVNVVMAEKATVDDATQVQ